MMTKDQAIAYGRRTGVRFYVENSFGGLLGGFTTRERAEQCKAEWEKEYKNDPFCRGLTVTVSIREV